MSRTATHGASKLTGNVAPRATPPTGHTRLSDIGLRHDWDIHVVSPARVGPARAEAGRDRRSRERSEAQEHQQTRRARGHPPLWVPQGSREGRATEMSEGAVNVWPSIHGMHGRRHED
jgi:hypothetical protein